MSSSVKSNNVILALVLYENNSNTLDFFIGVHIGAKKNIKKLCFFSQKSETFNIKT